MITLIYPNSDGDRCNVLENSSNLIFNSDGTVKPEAEKIFLNSTIEQMRSYAPLFIAKYKQMNVCITDKSNATLLKNTSKSDSSIIINHYFQGLFNGIDRKLFQAADLALYGMDITSRELPRLISDDDILRWGSVIAEGEAARVARGGVAMSMPSAVEVKTLFDIFKSKQNLLAENKLKLSDIQGELKPMRIEVNALIHDLWDEVVFYYRKSAPAARRMQCRQWGLRYKSRNGENNFISGTAAPAQVTSIANNTFTDKTIFSISNTGDITLLFYTADSATAAAPANAYSLPRGANANIPPAILGNMGNTFLNVFNADTVKEGKFEVEIF